MTYRHFERFCNGKCKFGELTLKLGERYMMYLTTQARAMKPRYERLGTNTAAAYFAVFKKILRGIPGANDTRKSGRQIGRNPQAREAQGVPNARISKTARRNTLSIRCVEASCSIFVPYGTAHQRHIEAALGGG